MYNKNSMKKGKRKYRHIRVTFLYLAGIKVV
jgi:hypothetical protein